MPALKDILEGKPVRSPLHPAVVHLPIALFPISSLLDLVSVAVTEPDAPLVSSAFICLLAGIVSALIAAVFGFVDYTEIRDDHPGKKTATAHMILNLVAVGIYSASAGLRYGTLDEPRVGLAPLILSLIGLGLISYSGYLGGKMVYDDGIAVGRHRRDTPLPQKTVIARSKESPVAVGSDAGLREGETMRVSVNGTVIALARADGAIHAFQEFCTHRYGPLSEGELKGCEVTCPWHRSRFDIRTGKVTSGPAKIDLRTFRTEVRDGQILVYV